MDSAVAVRYAAVRGSRLSDETARRVGPRLAEIEAIEGGITPASVVEHARAADLEELREWFEWDDGVAGRKWREQQARVLIDSIAVVVGPPDSAERVRAFHLVVEQTDASLPARRYHSIQVVQSNPDMTAQVVQAARGELEAFARKYMRYREHITREAPELIAVIAALGGVFDERI